MRQSQNLKAELKKAGIHTETQLKEALKKTSLDISIMAAVLGTERMAS